MKRLVSVALAGLCLTFGNGLDAQEIPKDAVLPTDNTYINSPGASQFPGANAVFLSDDVVFRVTPDGTTTYDEHDVVKVFTPAGVEEHKDLVRVYRSDLEKVELVRARTILPDGRVMEIPKMAVVDEAVFDKDETTTKGNMRRLVVRYPAVAANCIIEFHLRTTRKAYPGNKWWAVSYVQNPDPMVESKFTVEVPRGTRWRWAAPGLPALSPEKTEVGDFERATWVVRQSPALNQEAAAPAILTQMRRIEVSNFENWAELRSWFDQAFEQSVDVTGATQTQASSLVGNLTRPTDKIEAVASWVSKKRFLAGGLDDFRPRRASELVEEKVLNQVDGAILMAGLLRAAGLTVQPVLAFEQPPEEMATALPRFNRVDAVMLRVSNGAESWWVDPRHPLEYTTHAPSGFQGGSALLLASTEQPFERLQVTDADANRVVTDIEARLDEKGKLELRFHTTEHGDSGTVYREASRELLESGKDERDTNLQRLFDRIARNYSARARVIEKYFSLEARQGEPIDFSATLSLPDYAVRLGDKMALPLPIRLNPQLVGLAESDEPRQHPVRLDHPWREEHRMRLHLPAGAQVNELPPTVHIKSPFGEYFATSRSQGKEIYYYSRLVVNDAWVPRAQASELSDFAKKVLAARSKPVVLNLPKTAQSGK